MPTADRRSFVMRAIGYFSRQDYPAKELVVVDDGHDPIDDLVPPVGNIRYVRLTNRTTLGEKRNLACEQARGEIIVHWDDDDWHAPYQVSYQVSALVEEGADVCGISTLLFFDMMTGHAWRYVYPPGERFWISGSTLCYRKSFWAGNPFPSVDVGEDAYFIWAGRPDQMVTMADSKFHIGIIHPHNASPKHTPGSWWEPYPIEEIRQLMGDDWVFYRSREARIPDEPRTLSTSLPSAERSIGMFTVAREADLDLPEFGAFNYGQSAPRMRRWELPFALFQSRLTNTMAVLDCTINPVNFQERLTRLYSHTLYRHWNPIQNGEFVLPLGVPDEAFDRVICINTLEHLLRTQREALMSAMARKLKAGGWLILTSDYYFDSSWNEPAFLESGVMRPDREEVFNGWNKLTIADWIELCRRYDLHPLGDVIEDPQEADPNLYRNESPFPHGCIAGIFCKGAGSAQLDGKKIVLALLTWNTRDVSVDSVRAYIREARMLRRLGQLSLICVCDNGSTDGTAEALRAVEAEADIPHEFIYNRENLGNSVARNQIIHAMREWGGDYLLLMDGDIQIVPFSSFAMLRHMENTGYELGCIGADSAGQTAHPEYASPFHYNIDNSAVESTRLVAWTQYGMFRRAIFDDGVRFDEADPFDRIGWGFEDNDLAFQMETKGYLNQRFFGMTYLHRQPRSSIRIMREQGIDPIALCERRRQRVIEKWSPVASINNGPLDYVRQFQLYLE